MQYQFLNDNEVNEIKSRVYSFTQYELVMIRRGIIQVSDDLMYHYDTTEAIKAFMEFVDIRLVAIGTYNVVTCKFNDSEMTAKYQFIEATYKKCVEMRYLSSTFKSEALKAKYKAFKSLYDYLIGNE